VRLFFIAASQRGPAESFDSEMIEFAALNAKVVNQIAQTATACQLRCQHGDELGPAGKRAKLLTGVMFLSQSVKFMSREKTYYLRKNSATMCHGLEPPVINVFLAKSL